MNVMTQFSAARDYGRDLRFQAMFEGAAIGIAICQLDGSIWESNPALSRMLGYSQYELSGTHALDLYPERSARRSESPTAGALSNRPPDDPTQNQTHDQAEDQGLAELLGGRRASFEIEKHYRRKDGSKLWGHLTVSLGRDARHQPAFLIATLADASERKSVEEHLRAAEKMEVIGRLAGGIAHDFNNLLTGVLLYCDLLSAGLEKQSRAPSTALGGGEQSDETPPLPSALRSELFQHIEEVRRAGEQGAAMTRQLLAIARRQASEPRPVSLNATVASTANLLRRLIGEHIELLLHLDPALDSDAGLVLVDPAQLRQILLNLVLNARDSMPRGGKITVSTCATQAPSDLASDFGPDFARNGGQDGNLPSPRSAIALAVTDNGCGMSTETRARLFEPFFTTKEPGAGTGLGLATVQRIVSESSGTISVHSGPGTGTRVEVFFPLIGAGTNLSATAPGAIVTVSPFIQRHAAEPVSQACDKIILLLHDHAPARKSVKCALLRAGYRVLEASNINRALKLLAERQRTPDLAIVHCTAPGMTRRELAASLRRNRPGMKSLLISGHRVATQGAEAALGKPFSASTLIERVRALTERDATAPAASRKGTSSGQRVLRKANPSGPESG